MGKQRPKVIRVESREDGSVRYAIDRGEAQLLGPWYETREEAERALGGLSGERRTDMTREEATLAAIEAAKQTGLHQEVYRTNAGGYDIHSRMHGQELGSATVAVVAPDGSIRALTQD